MKKLGLIFFGALYSFSATAANSSCGIKQENAASYTIAQEIGIAVQSVEVLVYIPGVWTEAVGNNAGSDVVEVKAPNKTTKDMVIKRYIVSAKQIGTSDDCNVISVTEDTLAGF